MKKLSSWAAVFLVLLSFAVAAKDFTGKVIKVVDGDTLKVLHGETETVRLEGIDAPETSQPFGKQAKQFASTMVLGKEVTVKATGKDRYGRTLGVVFLRDGKNLNQELVRAGFAWVYRQYSHDKELLHLEAEARKAKRGLWRDPHPIAPWEYRHSVRRNRAAFTPDAFFAVPAFHAGVPATPFAVAWNSSSLTLALSGLACRRFGAAPGPFRFACIYFWTALRQTGVAYGFSSVACSHSSIAYGFFMPACMQAWREGLQATLDSPQAGRERLQAASDGSQAEPKVLQATLKSLQAATKWVQATLESLQAVPTRRRTVIKWLQAGLERP